MLQRFSQIGEFYVLSKPSITPKEKQSGFMDVLIYDEEADRHVKITYRQALEATGAVIFKATQTQVDEYNAAIEASANAKGVNAPAAIAALQYATTDPAIPSVPFAIYDLEMTGGVKFTDWVTNALALLTRNEAGLADAAAVKNFDALADAPVVIARPFIEHAMLSAVLAVSGADTGATIFGPSDMQISVSLRTRTHGIDRIPITSCSSTFAL